LRSLTGAFSFCSSLVNISIPEGVTSIEANTFSACSSLVDISIPEGVTSIGRGAFESCISLTSISIPSKVTIICSSGFYGCTSLEIVNISDGVTEIGDYAFCHCDRLLSVSLGRGIKSIGNSAFYGCESLYKITNYSPLQLTCGSEDNGYIAQHAEVVITGDGNDGNGITTEDGFLFSCENGVYKLLAYLGDEETITLPKDINGSSYEIYRMRGVKNVIIPDGITTIGTLAFYGCDSLTSIVIPEGVTSIGDSAFA